jgi:deoxyribose-phosphate aldolase
MIEMCGEILAGSDVKISALVSYPHGGMTIRQKADEAIDAVSLGAEEIQFVINTREVLSGNWDYIYEEMKMIREAVPENTAVKAVIECEYYSDDEIANACRAALKADIDWIVTSTGEYCYVDENKNDIPIVTSLHDIELIRNTVGSKIKIQAEGNIDSLELAISFFEHGVSRVSSSRAAAIYKEFLAGGAIINV